MFQAGFRNFKIVALKTKTIVVIIVAVTLIAATLIVLLHKPTIQGRQAITAIPLNSSLIIKTNGINQFFSLLSDNAFFEKLDKENFNNNFTNYKTTIDSLCNENSFADKILNDSAIYFSMHYNNNAPFGILAYLSIGVKSSIQPLLASISDIFIKKGVQFIRINKDSTLAKIIESRKQKKPSIFFYYENGLLVIGNNSKNIVESFVQFNKIKSLNNDTSFIKVYNSTGKKVAGSLYINLQQLPNLLSAIVKPGYMAGVRKILNSKGWAALDFNVERNYVSLHGFSINNEKKTLWIKALKNEQPVENYISKALPASTVFYGINEFKDAYNYHIAFDETVRNDNKLALNLKNLRQSFGSKIDDSLINIIDHSVAIDVSSRNENTFDIYCIVKTKNILEARNFLASFQKNNTGKLKRNIKKPSYPVAGQNETLFVTLPAKNLPVVLFGQVFDCGKYPVACNYKEFIVFGESVKSLRSYIEEINEKTIADDSLFRSVSNELLASKANLTLYLNFQKIFGFIGNYMLKDNSKVVESIFSNKNAKTILGLQVSGNGQYFYNNCFLYNQSQAETNPLLAWSSKTDKNIALIQSIMPGFSSRDIQYFVQDSGCNIYLFSITGKRIWKKTLPEKILSSIYVIDYFKNKKHQLLFNTAQYIYLFDKNGKPVKGFPVKLKHRATNGLALADFDNDRNYRYYLAFSNNEFVSLAKDGKKADGWKFDKTKNTVKQPAQCFKFQNYNFILFSDSGNIYLLNRKGIQTMHFKGTFSKSVNNSMYVEEKPSFFRIVTTDYSGTICYIYPDGHIEKNNMGTFPSDHYFEPIDLDGTGTNEYLFADSTSIYAFKQNKKEIFSINTHSPINQKPVCIKSKKNELFIVTSSKIDNKLYMFHNNGRIVKGFPIHGNFPMKVLSLSNLSYIFSLAAADANNLNYYIIQ